MWSSAIKLYEDDYCQRARGRTSNHGNKRDKKNAKLRCDGECERRCRPIVRQFILIIRMKDEGEKRTMNSVGRKKGKRGWGLISTRNGQRIRIIKAETNERAIARALVFPVGNVAQMERRVLFFSPPFRFAFLRCSRTSIRWKGSTNCLKTVLYQNCMDIEMSGMEPAEGMVCRTMLGKFR